jgi:GPH family glycoside/pentoside/hexuronide:cation symporter
MTFTCRETNIRVDEAKPQLWESILNLITNLKFWVAGFANAFYIAAMALVLASMPFFVKYALGLSGGQTTFLLAWSCSLLLPVLLSGHGWPALINASVEGCVGHFSGGFIPLYFANSLVSGMICSALVGFGFAGVITTMDLIGAKIMDEDTRKHNVRREGIISNALGFMNRLSGLFTSVAFFLVYRLYGYESGANPGTQPDQASRFLLTIVPPVLMLISFAFSFFINFENIEVTPAVPEVG